MTYIDEFVAAAPQKTNRPAQPHPYFHAPLSPENAEPAEQ
jgi:hypothetical protein